MSIELDEAMVERVARRWCEIHGLEPDESVLHDVVLSSPRWKLEAQRIRDFIIIQGLLWEDSTPRT